MSNPTLLQGTILFTVIGFALIGFGACEWGLIQIWDDNVHTSPNNLGPLPKLAVGERKEFRDLTWVLDKVTGVPIPPPGKFQQDSRVIAEFIEPEMVSSALTC